MSDKNVSHRTHWYAVYTNPKQEDRAAYNLNAWGVETFAPKIRSRRYNEFTGRPVDTPKPLFPRYIFARFTLTESLHKICFTRGIRSVVSFGGEPTRVDDAIIQAIRMRTGSDGLIRMDDELKYGDEVVIKSGPFKSLVGVFERELSDSDRVSLLLKMINYQSHIVLPRDHVGKVEQDAAQRRT